MKEIIENIVKLAEAYDSKGFTVESKYLDNIALSIVKVSQYVGNQGYWVRNSRCWSNCYRTKRAGKPNTATQDILLECLDEYNKYINEDGSKWDNYAKLEKSASNKNTALDIKIASKLNSSDDIFSTLEEIQNDTKQKYEDTLLSSAMSLQSLAESVKSDKELYAETQGLMNNMIKEAGPFGAMKDWGKAFWQKGKDVYKDVQNNALQNRNNRQVQELYTNFSKLTPEAQQVFLAKTQPTQQSNNALVPSATPAAAAAPVATPVPQATSVPNTGAAATTPPSTPAATQVATALTSKMKDIKNELAKLQDKPTAYQAVLQFMSDNGMTDPVVAQGFAKFFTGFDGSNAMKPSVKVPQVENSIPLVSSPVSMEDGVNRDNHINMKGPASSFGNYTGKGKGPKGPIFTPVNDSNQQVLSSTSKMLFKIA